MLIGLTRLCFVIVQVWKQKRVFEDVEVVAVVLAVVVQTDMAVVQIV